MLLKGLPEGSFPHALPRPGRACPGHPRRTGPQGAPNGCGPLRDWSGRGTAWVPGTGPGMTGESVGLVPTWFRRPGRACPGHPRRTGPQGASNGCRPLRDRSGRGTAWVPGTGPCMTREGGGLVPLMAPPSWPGLSRPPTPDRAAGRTGRLRPPPRSVRPGQDAGDREGDRRSGLHAATARHLPASADAVTILHIGRCAGPRRAKRSAEPACEPA